MIGKITCTSPRERAAMAVRIRAKRDELGYTAADLRVRTLGAFAVEVEAEPEIFEQFFARAP